MEHTYARSGTYTISSTATTSQGTFNDCGQPTVTGTKSVTVNRPPIARNDAYIVAPGDAFDANVLENDRDPDGDKITAVNWKLKEPGESSFGAHLATGSRPSRTASSCSTYPNARHQV